MDSQSDLLNLSLNSKNLNSSKSNILSKRSVIHIFQKNINNLIKDDTTKLKKRKLYNNNEEDDNIKILDTLKIQSLLLIINENYKEDPYFDERFEDLTEIKQKVWRVVRFIKNEKKKNNGIFNLQTYEIEKESRNRIFNLPIMHPDNSRIRKFIEFVVYVMLIIDIIISSYDYLAQLKHLSTDNTREREIVFDVFFSLDIIFHLFTGYYDNNLLILNYKKIFINYLKFGLIFDLIYVLPFWLLNPYLIFLRLIKIYKLPFIIKKCNHFFMFLTSFIMKNIKLTKNLVKILTFFLLVFFTLHLSACFWICIGSYGMKFNKPNWIGSAGLTDTNSFSKYLAAVYFLLETMQTIGYGDLPPQNSYEMLYIMLIQIFSIGFFAYLISCILEVVSNFNSDYNEMKNVNYNDLENWLLQYNLKIPKRTKLEILKKREPIFTKIKKYFLLFIKFDHSWITKCNYIKQMRPAERNMVMNTIFNNLYKIFDTFFSGLENKFKYTIAINMMTKFIDQGDNKRNLIREKLKFSEKSETNKNKPIEFIYFIIKGSITVLKNNEEVLKLNAGSFFGDEFLLDKHSNFTYRANNECVYFFIVPIQVIAQLCNNYEESYMLLVYKALLRINKFNMIYNALFRKKRSEIHINNFSSMFEKNPEPDIESSSPEGDSKILTQIKPKRNTETFIHSNYFRNYPSANLESKEKNKLVVEDEPELDHNYNKRSSKLDLLDNLFEQEDVLEKININDEIFKEIILMKKQKKKLRELLNYVNSIEKKMDFFNYQGNFLKHNIDNVMKNTKIVLDKIKNKVE